MAYNTNKKTRIKDLRKLATRNEALIDELSDKVDTLAQALLTLTNSVIANIERGEVT